MLGAYQFYSASLKYCFFVSVAVCFLLRGFQATIYTSQRLGVKADTRFPLPRQLSPLWGQHRFRLPVRWQGADFALPAPAVPLLKVAVLRLLLLLRGQKARFGCFVVLRQGVK